MTLDRCRVGIAGLGLMGGSLGMALGGHCRARIGHDCLPATARRAVEIGAVERTLPDLAALAGEVDLLVLATPVASITGLLGELGEPGTAPAHVMDLGSSKREVIEAMSRLPRGCSPVGGHPMCGKETSGIDAADADLYRDAVFVLTPLPRTAAETMELAHRLVDAVGARPVVLDAETHDRIAATVSHAPYLVAAALSEAARLAPVGVEPLAASGFRDTTRIAASNVEMMRDVLTTNRDEVAGALARFAAALDVLAEQLRGGNDDALAASLERIRSWRRELFDRR